MSGRFALDRSLLNPDFPDRQWGNLGLWVGATDYAAANEALAVRLAEAAGLRAGSRVLDVGFGHGDQLLLWKRRFEVGPVTGVEVDPAGLTAARERLAAYPDVALGPDGPWPEAHFDAALALDCAYHFPERPAFFGRVLQALRPGGVLALTDLALPRPATGLTDRLARACDIPPANLMTAGAYQAHLAAVGFVDVRVERLDGVLEGFASYALGHLARGGVTFSAGGVRVGVTALAARWLARRDLVRYVLVTARKSA